MQGLLCQRCSDGGEGGAGTSQKAAGLYLPLALMQSSVKIEFDPEHLSLFFFQNMALGLINCVSNYVCTGRFEKHDTHPHTSPPPPPKIRGS